MRSWQLWAFVVAVAVAVVVAAWAGQNNETPAKPALPALAANLPPDQLVVTAVPYQYETEYEMDPFDRTVLRRTKTRVTHVLIIHADGSSQVKPAD